LTISGEATALSGLVSFDNADVKLAEKFIVVSSATALIHDSTFSIVPLSRFTALTGGAVEVSGRSVLNVAGRVDVASNFTVAAAARSTPSVVVTSGVAPVTFGRLTLHGSTMAVHRRIGVGDLVLDESRLEVRSLPCSMSTTAHEYFFALYK
jgi:hypothetical protein